MLEGSVANCCECAGAARRAPDQVLCRGHEEGEKLNTFLPLEAPFAGKVDGHVLQPRLTYKHQVDYTNLPDAYC